jgi:hypothetical protein
LEPSQVPDSQHRRASSRYGALTRPLSSVDRGLAPPVVGIAFEGAITPALLDRAGAILVKHPDIRLQTDGTITNLDFLTDLPPVRDLSVMLGLDLANVDALAAHASSLSYLHLETGLPALDVAVLGELNHLQQMYLHKRNRTLKGLTPALTSLTQVRHLTLHSITLPNPDPLLAISGLRGLVFKLGGNRDLHYLTVMRELRFLEVWGVSKFRDTSFLADCHQLRAFYLQDLPHAVLPDMSQADSLTDVQLVNLPAMSGHMARLAAAPHLRYVTAGGCKLTRQDVAAFRGHPTLTGAWLPGPDRRSADDVDPVLGLPRPPLHRPMMRAAGVMALPAHAGEFFDT